MSNGLLIVLGALFILLVITMALPKPKPYKTRRDKDTTVETMRAYALGEVVIGREELMEALRDE